jgi:hypothetical protein
MKALLRTIPVAVCLAAVTFLLIRNARNKPHFLDAETITYAKQYIRFQNVRASAKADYRGQTVGFLHIDVANNGPRAIKELDVELWFWDTSGNVFATEHATAVSPRLRPLGPGQTRDFLHGFDLKDSWNHTSPTIRIDYLELK